MKSNFTTPFSLIKPFNEGPKYGGATISLNNKEMFICACTPNGGYFNCDIFHTTNKKIVKSIVEDDIKFDTTMYEWPLIHGSVKLNIILNNRFYYLFICGMKNITIKIAPIGRTCTYKHFLIV